MRGSDHSTHSFRLPHTLLVSHKVSQPHLAISGGMDGARGGGARQPIGLPIPPTASPTCVTPASPHNLGRDGRCQSVGARQHIGLILVQVGLHSVAALGAAAAGPVGLLQRPLLDLRGMRRKFGLGSWVGNLSLNGSRCRALGGAGAATVGLVRSPLLNQNPNTQQLPLLQCPVPPFPLFSSPHLGAACA